MARSRKKLGEILIEAGVLDDRRLRMALMEQQRWGGHLGRILIDMKLVPEDVLVQALSRQLNFPTINLDGREITSEVLELLPADVAEQNSLIPFNCEGKFLDVAMTDPTNLGIVDELRIRTRLNVRAYLAGPKMIERAMARFYGRGAGLLEMSMQRTASVDPNRPDPYGGIGTVELDSSPRASMSSAQRRAASAALHEPKVDEGRREIANVQERLAKLEALLTRDEDVIRKLLGLLVEKGVATREEILERIR